MRKPRKKRRRKPLSGIDWSNPDQQDTVRAALAFVESGLSLLPISGDGSKMPAFELLPQIWSESEQRKKRRWSVFRERHPTPDELRHWFDHEWQLYDYGFAVLGGAISGGLEIIDLDNWDIVGPWSELVESAAPGLLKRLVRVRTPRPGMHAYFRCEAFGGNQKLARVKDADPETDKPKPKTIIEVKAEGGYCLAPESPACCYPRNVCYGFLGDRDLTMVPTISPDERDVLYQAARELDEWEDPKPAPRPRPVPSGRRDRPGDDFNARADWADVLEPHGWTRVGVGTDGVEYWRRPGKTERGMSATANYEGSGVFYVFSTSADPFEEQTGYSKFHAYALLNHDGDFGEAAGALAEQGFGRARRRRRKKQSARSRRSGSRKHRVHVRR